jgi:hypothetical protein
MGFSSSGVIDILALIIEPNTHEFPMVSYGKMRIYIFIFYSVKIPQQQHKSTHPLKASPKIVISGFNHQISL